MLAQCNKSSLVAKNYHYIACHCFTGNKGALTCTVLFFHFTWKYKQTVFTRIYLLTVGCFFGLVFFFTSIFSLFFFYFYPFSLFFFLALSFTSQELESLHFNKKLFYLRWIFQRWCPQYNTKDPHKKIALTANPSNK